MQQFAITAEAIAATTKKLEKTRLLAELLRALPVEEAAVAALFFSGRVFPAYAETTLKVGGAMLWQALKEVSGATDTALTAAYRRHGDTGAAAAEVLSASHPPLKGKGGAPAAEEVLEKSHPGKTGQDATPRSQNQASRGPRGGAPADLSLLEVEQRLRAISEMRRAGMKTAQVAELLRRASAREAKYLVKLIAGELRIGLRESQVEEAIAQAFGASVRDVRRANMLLGDIGETLRLAAAQRLGEARMRLFHPLGFMLASPAQDAAEAFAEFQHAVVEDKYDGIRAQAHVARDGGELRVRLFSRTLDEVTESFPELVAPLAAFDADVVLDGEIVAWAATSEEATRVPPSPEGEGWGTRISSDAHGTGQALPFAQLQRRLGRKRVQHELMRAVPVAYVAFDVLYAEGELQIDRGLRARAEVLDRVFANAKAVERAPLGDAQGALVFEPMVTEPNKEDELGRVLRAPVATADSAAALDELFDRAQARGNEGLMIKDVESPYTPGRRGRSWLKLKRELATLDVVVTAVEWGHGKRAQVLSDYTFAVRSGDELLNVGKAYSGLTDAEISEMTEWFLAHAVEDRGFTRIVEPRIVIEVAFNAVMKSDRHASGYALRFPRILRLRPDKPVREIDTVERVREIYEAQGR